MTAGRNHSQKAWASATELSPGLIVLWWKALRSADAYGVRRGLELGMNVHELWPADDGQDSIQPHFHSCAQALLKATAPEQPLSPAVVECLDLLMDAGLTPQQPFGTSALGATTWFNAHPEALARLALRFGADPFLSKALAPAAALKALNFGHAALGQTLLERAAPMDRWPLAELATALRKKHPGSTLYGKTLEVFREELTTFLRPLAFSKGTSAEHEQCLAQRIQPLNPAGGTTTRPTQSVLPGTGQARLQAQAWLIDQAVAHGVVNTLLNPDLPDHWYSALKTTCQPWLIARAVAQGQPAPDASSVMDIFRSVARNEPFARIGWAMACQGRETAAEAERQLNEDGLFDLLMRVNPLEGALHLFSPQQMQLHPCPTAVRAGVRWLREHPAGPFEDTARELMARYVADSAAVTRAEPRDAVLVQDTVMALCENDLAVAADVVARVNFVAAAGYTHIPLWDTLAPSRLVAWSANLAQRHLDAALPAATPRERVPRL